MRCNATVTLISLGLWATLGCGGGSTAPSSPSHSDTSARQFVDRLDRNVQFTAVPQRVISLSPETTELLFAIGAGDRVVGVTDYCNYPELAAKLPKVGGGTLETLSLEAMVELRPDLVLCKWDSHQPLIQRLQRVGIQAFAVGPTGLASLYEEAEKLGRLLDCRDPTQRWTAGMKREIQTQRERVPNQHPEERSKVFYQVWHDPLMSVNNSSFIGEVLELAGLTNVFADLEAPFPTVSSESVVQRDPDIILAPNTSDDVVQQIRARPGWSTVSAIRKQRVYLINPDTISRCGPRLAVALEEIVDQVYGKDGSSDHDLDVAAENKNQAEASRVGADP